MALHKFHQIIFSVNSHSHTVTLCTVVVRKYPHCFCISGENKKPKVEEMAKKERKKQRRMQKDNYEMSAKAKDLWNALRR